MIVMVNDGLAINVDNVLYFYVTQNALHPVWYVQAKTTDGETSYTVEEFDNEEEAHRAMLALVNKIDRKAGNK